MQSPLNSDGKTAPALAVSKTFLYEMALSVVSLEGLAKRPGSPPRDIEIKALEEVIKSTAMELGIEQCLILTREEESRAVWSLFWDFDEDASSLYDAILAATASEDAGSLLDFFIKVWEKAPLDDSSNIFEKWIAAFFGEYGYREGVHRLVDELRDSKGNLIVEIEKLQVCLQDRIALENTKSFLVVCDPEEIYSLPEEKMREKHAHLRILKLLEPERFLTENLVLIPGSLALVKCFRNMLRRTCVEVGDELTLATAETAYRLWKDATAAGGTYYEFEAAYKAASML